MIFLFRTTCSKVLSESSIVARPLLTDVWSIQFVLCLYGSLWPQFILVWVRVGSIGHTSASLPTTCPFTFIETSVRRLTRAYCFQYLFFIKSFNGVEVWLWMSDLTWNMFTRVRFPTIGHHSRLPVSRFSISFIQPLSLLVCTDVEGNFNQPHDDTTSPFSCSCFICPMRLSHSHTLQCTLPSWQTSVDNHCPVSAENLWYLIFPHHLNK